MRERWDSRTAFLMASIGSAVGLGNVWRFPYMVYQNGGGAFLIPYFIALLTAGIPLMMLEYNLGMKFQAGPAKAINSLKKGFGFIGWFALLVSFVIVAYYVVIMAWSWNYLFYSIGTKWAGNEKNFFYNSLINISDSVGNIGTISFPVVIGLLITWVSIFLIIFKGVKVVGKVVNLTVPLPIILLAVLIIRGITLPGSGQGLNFYLNPDFSKLLNPRVWLAAYGQIFFSLSLGFGILIAYSSYMPKDSDVSTNAFITSFANCATSFFAGFAVFSTLGYLALSTQQPVDKVVTSGIGLAFITFPTAIAKIPGGLIVTSIFGIVFFIMLLTLGIDSAFSLVEAVVTGVRDEAHNIRRGTLTFFICLVGFLAGLIFCTRSGLYWLDIVDHWMNSFGLIVVGLMEVILVGWLCNTKTFRNSINQFSDIKVGKWWEICIRFITPAIIGLILILSFIQEIKSPYGNYPLWAIIIGGWLLVLVLMIIAIAITKSTRASIK